MGALDGTDCSDQLFVGAPVNVLWLIRTVMLDYSKQFNNTAQPDSTVGGILDNLSTPSPLSRPIYLPILLHYAHKSSEFDSFVLKTNVSKFP